MGEAAPKEPTMEDILASIRRIVAQDEAQPAAPARHSTAAAPAATSRPPAPARPPVPAEPAGGFARLAQEVTSQMPARPGQPSARGSEIPARAYAAASPAPARTAPAAAPAPRPPVPAHPAARAQIAPRPEPARPAAERRSDPLADLGGRPAPARPLDQPARAPASPAVTDVGAGGQRPRASEQQVEAFRNALVSPGTEAAVEESLKRLKQGLSNNLDARVEAVLRPMLREWLDRNLPALVEKLVRAEIERLARKG
ncbi:MAG: hypothetical protein BroJett030_07890 [Alphaproteobacteria bacterium]|nr:MAG: hypothetical protein BroJett030_07890 [Alphaproteobacteria bacterium]